MNSINGIFSCCLRTVEKEFEYLTIWVAVFFTGLACRIFIGFQQKIITVHTGPGKKAGNVGEREEEILEGAATGSASLCTSNKHLLPEKLTPPLLFSHRTVTHAVVTRSVTQIFPQPNTQILSCLRQISPPQFYIRVHHFVHTHNNHRSRVLYRVLELQCGASVFRERVLARPKREQHRLLTRVNKSFKAVSRSDMDYALNVKMDYPVKTEYSDYEGSDYSGFEDSKKRKVMEGGDGTSTVKLSRDELKKLLEPLSKEQLVGLLIDAGSQFPAVADDIRDSASKDPVHRKLFVRGLAWETSSVALREAFEQYGEVEEACVITDKGTGKSRGFGFITFKHMDSAQRALKEPSKNIDGRITVCNLASAGGSSGTSSSDQAQRKLYIGGLSYETTSDTLLNIFSQYGEIEEGAIAYDKNTNKSRGFAFVTFKTVEGAKRAMEDSNKTIEGRHVTVKLAAEGQRDRQQPQAGAGQLQSMPQGQYSSLNPSVSNYSRPQMATSAPQTLSFSAYAPLAYGTQGTYGSLVPSTQYGGLSTSPQPYTPSQYGQYATFGNQSTIPTVGSIQGGSLSSYYTGTN